MSSQPCKACNKSAYPLESVIIDGMWFHKPCFKCKECQMCLSLTNYAMIHGDSYCKPHFKQKFAENGGQYDAFGQNPNHKTWEKVNYTPGMNINSKVVGDTSSISSRKSVDSINLQGLNSLTIGKHSFGAPYTPSSIPENSTTSESKENSDTLSIRKHSSTGPGITPNSTPAVVRSSSPEPFSSASGNFGVVLNKINALAATPINDILTSKTEDGVLDSINARGGVISLISDSNPILLDAFKDDCKIAGKVILNAIYAEFLKGNVIAAAVDKVNVKK